MKPQIWLASLAGTGLAFTLAFSPVAMAQSPSESGTVMLQQGKGNTARLGGNPGTGGRSGTCDGVNFVDEDGDGVCDHLGTGNGTGTGTATRTGTKQQTRRGRP